MERLDLVSCVADQSESTSPARKYSIALIAFARQVSDDGTKLHVLAGFDTMDGIVEPICHLRATYRVTYRRPPNVGDAWADSIKDHVALAHIVPYFRELVCSMTGRLGVGALVVQPLNTANLLRKFRSRQAPQS